MIPAFIYGGKSVEHEISAITYRKIVSIYREAKRAYLGIYLSREGVFYLDYKMKRKKGSFLFKEGLAYFVTGRKKYRFDLAVPLGHGQGMEDGTIKGFFDTLQIPCASSSIVNAGILQNKAFFKQLVTQYKLPQTKYRVLTKNDFLKNDFSIEKFVRFLPSPWIVKPSNLGSSIGVKKATDIPSLIKAIREAMRYDLEIIIESMVAHLQEVNIAILGDEETLLVSELETVSNKEDVLSFYDKYLLTKDHTVRIIPADIDLEEKETIIGIAQTAFRKFHCFGIVRFDFLVNTETKKIYLNEVNAVPGSLALYLFEAQGKTAVQVLDAWYSCAFHREREQQKLCYSYEEGKQKQLTMKGIK